MERGHLDETDHALLKSVIKKYQSKGWNIDSEISEDNEEFRFPLLHWACVLGKIRTVRWLLDYGFSATVQTKDTQETCVHRALMTLPDITSMKSGRLSMLRFESLLPYFRDCLVMGDHRQDTPLHVAAQFMVQNRCFKLYENIFLSMLTEIKKLPLAKQHKCLNMQNASGDTVINLLASGCKSLMVIEKLLDAGADSMIVNKLNIGPLDNAQKHGLVHIANFLKSSLLSGCGVLPPPRKYKNNPQHDESRKRRSERRSNYSRTMLSLSMFCHEDTNKSLESERLSSPSKESEKSNQSNEPEDRQINVVMSEDEETSSQSSHRSSHISSFILPNGTEQLPTESEHPTENEEFPIAEIKHDDDFGICRCSEDENDNILTATDEKVQEKADSDVKLFDVMKEAGVLPDLADVIARTKESHLNRMKAIETSLSEMDEKKKVRRNEEKRIQTAIAQKKREIEKLDKELYTIKRQKVSMSDKRNLMVEERQDLKKKLVCCETLMKTVPKDTCS